MSSPTAQMHAYLRCTNISRKSVSRHWSIGNLCTHVDLPVISVLKQDQAVIRHHSAEVSHEHVQDEEQRKRKSRTDPCGTPNCRPIYCIRLHTEYVDKTALANWGGRAFCANIVWPRLRLYDPLCSVSNPWTGGWLKWIEWINTPSIGWIQESRAVKETARCRSCTFQFKVRRQHSLRV